MGSHDLLPGDILELVLLGLHSPLWLLRAASTCKRWRRLISGGGFLRRFRALRSRAPVVAGIYRTEQFYVRPRFEPSPSAAAVDARHFSLDFLPDDDESSSWKVMDSRGSLLLIYLDESKTGRKDLVVCDPLMRRQVVIPRPRTTAVLLDGDGGIGISSFRVLCVVQKGNRIHAAMFTSGSSSWRETRISWLPMGPRCLGVAAGRRYWYVQIKKTVITLDQSTLEFSSFMLPDDDIDRFSVTLTVGHDGEPRIVAVGGSTGATSKDLKIFARPQGTGAVDEEVWAFEKTIRLSAAMFGVPRLHRFYLAPHLEAGTVHIAVPAPGRAMRFLLDMETMEAKRRHGREEDFLPDYYRKSAYPLEFPWPPSLRACCCADDNDPYLWGGATLNHT